MTPRPLSTFLARLIWLCMAPLLLLAVWLTRDSLQEQEARHLREGANLAHNFAGSMDQHLRARINALHMLAVSPLADDERRWPELYAEAQGLRQSFGLHVIFADSERQMLFNTRQPYGARLPRLPDSRGRTAALLALETGQPQVGDIVVSPIDGRPLVAIAVPVLRENRPTRLMLSIFETAQFQPHLDRLALPAGWSIALRDGTGADIARRSAPGFDGSRDVADDHRFVARSELSPWSVLLEIPHHGHDAQLYRAGFALFAALLLATLLGMLGGTLASRRISRQVARLATPDGSAALPSDIAEVDLAQRRLAAAAEARAAAETALRERERMLVAIIANSPSALSLKSPDGHYVLANPNLQRIHHCGEAAIIGKTDFDLYPEQVARAFRANDERVLATRARCSVEEIVPVDGVERIFMSFMFPVLDARGGVDYICRIALDITERKQAERELAAAFEEQKAARLAALNQMEDANAARREVIELNTDLERRVAERTAELAAANADLESFAYAVSHDLRAPLRAMNGFSQALVEDYGAQLQGEAMGYLEQIGIASRKMTELIDGILALSRSTRGDLQRDAIDLSALARRRLDELARAEPARRVAVDVADGLVAHGDARMVEAIMTNLLDDAWKYTGKAAAPAIRVYRGEVAGQQVYCVADNGAGFDMAHAGRLFKPFQRLHRQDEFPGIGIGLATVQRIVRRHGGEIAGTGEPGRGATFCFSLPENTPEEKSPWS